MTPREKGDRIGNWIGMTIKAAFHITGLLAFVKYLFA
jgi:hypothetical protein